MKIYLKNPTRWRSDDLKVLLRRTLDYYLKHVASKPATVRVRCSYRRKRDGLCGGWAFYNDSVVVLKLPKDGFGYRGDSLEETVARTFLHELDHCRGLKHGEMTRDSNRDVSCVAGLKVRSRSVPKRQVPTDEDKVAHLQAQMKRWVTRKKRAETAIRNLKKRLRYYERKRTNVTPGAAPQEEVSLTPLLAVG